jgi:hypothetical protein
METGWRIVGPATEKTAVIYKILLTKPPHKLPDLLRIASVESLACHSTADLLRGSFCL